MAKIGYMRVSREDQNLALQDGALRQAGCARIFDDKASGAKDDREGLAAALDYCRPGDVLTVWRLDRLGRSLPHLIRVINELREREIGFSSLTEGFDTSTIGGELVFHIFGALAQFERKLTRARIIAGMEAARPFKDIGRPAALDDHQRETARKMYAAREPDGSSSHTVREIAELLKCSRPTIYKAVSQARGGGQP